MAEYHGQGDIWAVSSGALMGIIAQIQNPSGNDFIFRAAVGGVVGAFAAWLTKRLLDYLILPFYKKVKKGFANSEPEIKRYKKNKQ